MPPFGVCPGCLMTQMLAEPTSSGGAADATDLRLRDASIYDLEEPLAQGGMGTIHAARDRNLGRTVAMKVMKHRPGMLAESRLAFYHEARVLALLDHPNIVPVHDLGVDDRGTPFYTMKRVKGVSLEAVLAGLEAEDPALLESHTLETLLETFVQVCNAVAFAHSRGVLHRDLKPENIMLGEFGQVFVMDWGLARILPQAIAGGSPPMAAHGPTPFAGMGTAGYMPPEQVAGDGTPLDPRSDVFALGGILHAILTLRSPEAGSPRDTPSPRSDLPHGRTPLALSAVVRKAMDPEPQERYPTPLALADDIRAYRAGFATQAENASLVTHLRLLVVRHRKATLVAAAMGLLTLGLIVQWIAAEERALAAARQAQDLKAEANRGSTGGRR